MARRPFGQIKTRSGRPGYYVKFRHPDWKAPIERSTGLDKANAVQKLAIVEALVRAGRPLEEILAKVFGEQHGSRMTFREAVDPYLASAKKRLRPSTLKTHTSALRMMARTAWAKEYLCRLTHVTLNRWRMERLAGRPVVATLNRNMSVGSALFKWAKSMGYVKENPFREVEREKETGRREVYLTPEESTAFIDSCAEPLRAFVMAALHTGMRRGELVAITWRDVDLREGVIHIPPEIDKSDRGRRVPLTDALWDELRRLKRERTLPKLDGSDPMLARRDGRAWVPGTVSRAVTTAVRRCDGVSLGKRDLVTLHTLRHTVGTLMAQRGVSLFDIGKVLGHGSPVVTARYAHYAPEAGRAAMDSLGAAFNDQTHDGDEDRQTA